MTRVLAMFCFAFVVCGVSGETLAHFESAVASSTFASGAFKAAEATSGGSGYWCSAGGHTSGQVVTWTGVFGARQKALGVKLNWAYGPGEFKILTSGDGGNFEEAACWRKSERDEVSYEDFVMFDGPRSVKALTVAMQSPMPWGYFGLSDVALLVEPGPMMVVSGSGTDVGEACLVSKGKGLSMEDCLSSIASGTGREIFKLNDASQLESVIDGTCASLSAGVAVGGGKLIMQDCVAALESGDGRSVLEVSPGGQLKFATLGNYCVVVGSSGARVEDCSAVPESVFSLTTVPEFDSDIASSARGVASVLKAAAARQSGLLAQLQRAMATAGSCGVGFGVNATRLSSLFAIQNSNNGARSKGPALQAISEIDTVLGVDFGAIKAVIASSMSVLGGTATVGMTN